MNHNIVNLVLAIVSSIAIIFGWQHFYEKPKLERLAAEHTKYNQQIEEIKTTSLLEQSLPTKNDDAIPAGGRVIIKSELLSGSISLKGLRFDDLTLLQYKEDLTKNSKDVSLFSRSKEVGTYFAEIGWFASTITTDLPDAGTVWSTDNTELTPTKPVNLSWVNKDKVKFLVTIEMDDNYLFTIRQTTSNNSSRPISVQHYGLILKNHNSNEKSVNILHQGAIGVINSELHESSYDHIKDKKIEKFSKSSIDWIGITDKYWLASFIPDKTSLYSSNFNYAVKDGLDKFQVDFVSPSEIIEVNNQCVRTHRLFVGPKKVALLDRYETEYNIKLFDRAIDFGWFYIITKPIFNAMNFFYRYVGNFGLSILIVTIIIKLIMFTFANKSYRSMKNMKKLQPEIERLKALYSQDKVKLNQEIMTLYKREKVNPISGCLPMFIQIPVFFSIYKVLYVTIEMRHAPFFGWIKDLSAPDPTSIFNLFGLLPISLPGFLMIGVWPIIMALTMFLQQRMSPEPADPVQAQVMKFMPLIFLLMFSSFPAGLLIYWSWNNILSIIQQYYINKLDSN
jgi:YidC/Oxa1 family membrane protein insertase